MKGEWCYFRSYLSKDTCQKIINECLMIPPQDGIVGTNGGEQLDTRIRKSKVRFLNAVDWRFQYIFDVLWKTQMEANRDFFNIHVTRLNFVQFAEYSDQYEGEYKDHHDVFWLNGDDFYHRKLSCIIQLSDPSTYEGGDFEFVDTLHSPPANELREQGSIVYFPSFFRHRANRVTKGTRYSIAAWFEGPKWR